MSARDRLRFGDTLDLGASGRSGQRQQNHRRIPGRQVDPSQQEGGDDAALRGMMPAGFGRGAGAMPMGKRNPPPPAAAEALGAVSHALEPQQKRARVDSSSGPSSGSFGGFGRPPPAHYVCNRCGVPGHFIRDCPQAPSPHQQQQQRLGPNQHQNNQPPPGYVCRLCNEPGHFIRDCVSAASNGGGSERISGSRVGRRPVPGGAESFGASAPRPCWFCLSNEGCETHLVAAIGTYWYVALPKGGLSPFHAQIIPIEHVCRGEELPAAAMLELREFKAALTRFFTAAASVQPAKTDNDLPAGDGDDSAPIAAALFFQGRQDLRREFHLNWQAVPLCGEGVRAAGPLSVAQAAKSFVDNAGAIGVTLTQSECDSSSTEALEVYAALSEEGSAFPPGFFVAEVYSALSDSGQHRVHRLVATDRAGSGRRRDGPTAGARDDMRGAGNFNVPVSFGRQVSVDMLGLPGVMVDWRACARGMNKEKEEELTESFRAKFEEYVPKPE